MSHSRDRSETEQWLRKREMPTGVHVRFMPRMRQKISELADEVSGGGYFMPDEIQRLRSLSEDKGTDIRYAMQTLLQFAQNIPEYSRKTGNEQAGELLQELINDFSGRSGPPFAVRPAYANLSSKEFLR